MSVQQTVYVTHIHHEYGENYAVSSTEGRAEQVIYSYVVSWWEYELGDEPIPTNPADAIRRYFYALEGKEWAHIEEVTVDDEQTVQVL